MWIYIYMQYSIAYTDSMYIKGYLILNIALQGAVLEN